MSERPKLEKGLSSEVFLKYYYLKDELVEFCRKEGLKTTGRKIEITNRIAYYLDTGKSLEDRKTTSKSCESFTKNIDTITLYSKIEPNFKCTEKHRAFFKKEIGEAFKFNVAFQKWLKENTGKTYREAITCWKYKKSLPGHNKYEKEDLKAL